jgi:hypothetical protein
VQIETALKNLEKPERLRKFLQKSDHLKPLAPYSTPVASPKRMDSEEAAYREWQRLQVCTQVAITAAQKNLKLAPGVASGELYTAAAAAPNSNFGRCKVPAAPKCRLGPRLHVTPFCQ